MLEILGEDRERIEELHREIKKEQERIAIRSLIATQKALMMLEGMSLQDGFTGGAADAVETALKSVKKPILLSPIKGGM